MFFLLGVFFYPKKIHVTRIFRFTDRIFHWYLYLQSVGMKFTDGFTEGNYLSKIIKEHKIQKKSNTIYTIIKFTEKLKNLKNFNNLHTIIKEQKILKIFNNIYTIINNTI